MIIKISPETHQKLQQVVENLQLEQSVHQLAEQIITSFLASTQDVYNASASLTEDGSDNQPSETFNPENLVVSGPAATNFYLAFAILLYLKRTPPSKYVPVSDDDVNSLLSEFRENYPPPLN